MKEETNVQVSASQTLPVTEVDGEGSRDNMGSAMGRIVNGVYVLTLERNGARDGMLSTWLTQVSFEPPAIAAAIKQGRPILAELRENSHFVVNVLHKGSNHIFKNFAKPDLPGEERFRGLSCYEPINNVYGPVLDDAVAFFACRVIKQVETGDHVLVIAQVVAGSLIKGTEEPTVHLRKSGFQY